MKNNVCILLNILYSLFELSRSQYIMMNRKTSKSNQCDPNNNLVEQFFNVIFTEFHHTQPVCVCVQMCLEKPTYCYPNGCLRKPDRIKEDTTTAYPVNRVLYDSQSPSKSVMFLVDNDKDLIDNLLEEPRINSHSERIEKISSSDLVVRPNPFKELVLKYRKLPKLEMRYNLRDKVKNAQSEKIKRNKLDVSKTRWPMNKHLMHGKQLFNRIRHYKKDDNNQRTLFVSMFPELESVNNMATNKKLLTKREDNRGVNIDSVYVYKTDANFSIENLIDDLIINSLDDSNNMKVNAKVHSNESLVPATDTLSDISNRNSDGNLTVNGYKDIPINNEEVNTKVNIILFNSTHNNIDTNKYIHDLNFTNNNKSYSEEIANMANEIEKNNNVSIEFVKHVIGLRYFENEKSVLNTKNSSVESVKNIFDPALGFEQAINNNTINTTKSNNMSIELTATKRWTTPVLKTNVKQKYKQKIVRKLDRKIN